VLGHALWQRAFGGEPVVGKTVIVDSEPFTVVGIAPPGFQFPEGAELWAPLVLPDPAAAARDRHYLSVMGKLAQGRLARARRVAGSPPARAPEDQRVRTRRVPGFRPGAATQIW
jgi:hypothetical protein